MSSDAAQPGLALRPQAPSVEAGFEHVLRHWDVRRQRHVAKVAPGECFVTRSDDLISTVLGSCICTCVRDVRRGIGGMNHFMLPADTGPNAGSRASCVAPALRYGNYAMEHLLNAFYARGSARRDLEIKLFGGGQVIASSTRIGSMNIAFARDYLKTEGYEVTSECVGGFSGRKVIYDPVSGRALVKNIHSDEQQAILAAEQRYLERLVHAPIAGEVELF